MGDHHAGGMAGIVRQQQGDWHPIALQLALLNTLSGVDDHDPGRDDHREGEQGGDDPESGMACVHGLGVPCECVPAKA
ncbi:hypothetical protein ECTOBSL9_2968 [Ectothiorhodospira sp. BSL-9]|nr:hypothetical protein ECTOBSL9_2968 [Ectothiorhodospira sp. BSL-9]